MGLKVTKKRVQKMSKHPQEEEQEQEENSNYVLGVLHRKTEKGSSFAFLKEWENKQSFLKKIEIPCWNTCYLLTVQSICLCM